MKLKKWIIFGLVTLLYLLSFCVGVSVNHYEHGVTLLLSVPYFLYLGRFIYSCYKPSKVILIEQAYTWLSVGLTIAAMFVWVVWLRFPTNIAYLGDSYFNFRYTNQSVKLTNPKAVSAKAKVVIVLNPDCISCQYAIPKVQKMFHSNGGEIVYVDGTTKSGLNLMTKENMTTYPMVLFVNRKGYSDKKRVIRLAYHTNEGVKFRVGALEEIKTELKNN